MCQRSRPSFTSSLLTILASGNFVWLILITATDLLSSMPRKTQCRGNMRQRRGRRTSRSSRSKWKGFSFSYGWRELAVWRWQRILWARLSSRRLPFISEPSRSVSSELVSLSSKIREALLSSSIRPIPLATVLPSALTKPPYCLIKKVISPSYTMASITTRGILEKASTFGRMQRMVWCDCLSLVQQSKRWYYWIIFFKKTFKYDDIKN